MTEPGLDLHEWETRWSELDEAAHEAPEQAVAEMDRLLEQMLLDAGYTLDPVIGDEPEVVKQYLAAREVARAAEAGAADPGDVAAAIEGYRALYEHLVSGRPTP
jgi:hypothetical protein